MEAWKQTATLAIIPCAVQYQLHKLLPVLGNEKALESDYEVFLQRWWATWAA
jgi:hypothetical protein